MNRPDLPADTLQKNNLFFRQLLFLGILITIGLVILNIFPGIALFLPSIM